MAIVTCPGCGRSDLRIPDGRRATVTCPGCGAKWFHPETLEFSEVEFRCSKSGARFTVTATRRSPLDKFVIQEITKASSTANRPRSTEPAPSPQPTGKAVAPSSWLAAPKVGGWLARITGRNVAVSAPLQKAAAPAETTPVATHDISEYNWAGFSCPYCLASNFVHCRSGGHLACDGTAELRDGRRFHKCFCGGAGFITGAIKTIDDNRHSVEAELGAAKPPTTKNEGLRGEPAAIALPSPRRGGPLAKR
jgi:hypothetical protein